MAIAAHSIWVKNLRPIQSTKERIIDSGKFNKIVKRRDEMYVDIYEEW